MHERQARHPAADPVRAARSAEDGRRTAAAHGAARRVARTRDEAVRGVAARRGDHVGTVGLDRPSGSSARELSRDRSVPEPSVAAARAALLPGGADGQGSGRQPDSARDRRRAVPHREGAGGARRTTKSRRPAGCATARSTRRSRSSSCISRSSPCRAASRTSSRRSRARASATRCCNSGVLRAADRLYRARGKGQQ